MKNAGTIIVLTTLCVCMGGGLFAQDFGFGFDGEAETAGSGPPVSVQIGGEIAAHVVGFVYEFQSGETIKAASLGDMVSGALNFSVSGANADIFINFNISAAAFNDLSSGRGGEGYAPGILDEAYLRAFWGPVNIEAGLRKLTWGRADSFGPLDVINPLDYSDLTVITDIPAIKIARPLVHVSLNTGDFSKLEAVFVPNFAGHRFARGEDRWTPAQFSRMYATAETVIFARAAELLGSAMFTPGFDSVLKNTRNNLMDYFGGSPVSGTSLSKLKYFQTGLRYTTMVHSVDIGGQYFYGNMFRPGFTLEGVDAFLTDLVETITVNPGYAGNPALLSGLRYSRYHQIGVDYAQVVAGLNLRAEFAVNFTEDMSGDNGAVHNPFLAWSLGFDRDLFWGLNINSQCNETIRLLYGNIDNNPVVDCEADAGVTATRITVRLSRKFFRDNLEARATVIWDIEAGDSYIIPAIVRTAGDLSAEFSAGVFAGNINGEFGQYRKNSYVKAALKYVF